MTMSYHFVKYKETEIKCLKVKNTNYEFNVSIYVYFSLGQGLKDSVANGLQLSISSLTQVVFYKAEITSLLDPVCYHL